MEVLGFSGIISANKIAFGFKGLSGGRDRDGERNFGGPSVTLKSVHLGTVGEVLSASTADGPGMGS